MLKNRISLMPGVNLTVIHADKFKTNCISVSLLRPLCREEAALNALLPDVLLRGCRMCPDMGAISSWLDERYGSGVQATLRKKGEVQAVGLFLDYIDERYTESSEHLTEDICRLIGSFLLEPVLDNGVFREEFVAGEKINLINAIMSQINDKRSYASIRLRQEMFPEERYGVSKHGEVEDVEAITAESLYRHYEKVLETSQIEIIYTGSLPMETVTAYLTDALQGLPRGELVQAETAQGTAPDEVREITEVMDVNQGKLVMGFRTGITAGDPMDPALRLMNCIYGGGLNSKLFMNVREKMSLCYYASSGLERFKGIMIVSSGVDSDKYETARAEILRQLDACRDGDITEEEMESARRYLISAFRSSGDSPYSMDDYCLSQIIGGFEETPEETIRQLEQVTLEDICTVAKQVKLDTIYFLKGAEA